MPKKNRNKSEKKKSKKGLTTEDILKIIKKLKPKNQQIVKVNVGDRGDKKKKPGDVQSSYNPPFVFPPQGYSAITSPGQPPAQPPLMEAPRQAATWSSQPAKIDSILMPPPLRRTLSNEPFSFPVTTPRIAESDVSDVEMEKQKIKVRQPRTTRLKKPNQQAEEIFEEPLPLSFISPKTFNSSNLFSSSSAPTHFNYSVQNDKYQPDIIRTDNTGDQIGTISNSLPSDAWTGSPSGEITLSPEESAAVAAEIETELNPKDVFLEEEEQPIDKGGSEELILPPLPVEPKEILPPIPEEEKIIIPKKKKEKLTAPEDLTPVGKTKTPPSETSYTKTVKASLDIIAIVNDAIEKGFTSKNMPDEIIYKIGPSKGFVKKSATSYLLDPIYSEVKAFNKSKK